MSKFFSDVKYMYDNGDYYGFLENCVIDDSFIFISEKFFYIQKEIARLEKDKKYLLGLYKNTDKKNYHKLTFDIWEELEKELESLNV